MLAISFFEESTIQLSPVPALTLTIRPNATPLLLPDPPLLSIRCVAGVSAVSRSFGPLSVPVTPLLPPITRGVICSSTAVSCPQIELGNSCGQAHHDVHLFPLASCDLPQLIAHWPIARCGECFPSYLPFFYSVPPALLPYPWMHQRRGKRKQGGPFAL